MSICQDTAADAVTWTAERLEREVVETTRYMDAHWATMSEVNKQRILPEYRALTAEARRRCSARVPTFRRGSDFSA